MSAQPKLTVDALADAIAWRRENPVAYEALVTWAKLDMIRGIRPSMDCYGHLLRRPYMANLLKLVRRLNEPVLFNNDLTSSLARLVMREHSEIVFDTRHARSDDWRQP